MNHEIIDLIKKVRKEMNNQFDAMDKRFEQMNKIITLETENSNRNSYKYEINQ